MGVELKVIKNPKDTINILKDTLPYYTSKLNDIKERAVNAFKDFSRCNTSDLVEHGMFNIKITYDIAEQWEDIESFHYKGKLIFTIQQKRIAGKILLKLNNNYIEQYLQVLSLLKE